MTGLSLCWKTAVNIFWEKTETNDYASNTILKDSGNGLNVGETRKVDVDFGSYDNHEEKEPYTHVKGVNIPT